MSTAEEYLTCVAELVSRLDAAAIADAATLAVDAIASGGMVQVFGSGHSGLVAMEVAGRASGLAAVNALRDPGLSPVLPDRAGATERLPGYVAVSMDLWGLQSNDVLVVVSNSGINPAPNEVALLARQRGLKVIAITSRTHSQSATSRMPDGSRLADHADVVVDTGSSYGDWTVETDVARHRVGPASTILAMAALHAILVAATDGLESAGLEPPLIRSLNVTEGVSPNEAVQAPYRHRQQYS